MNEHDHDHDHDEQPTPEPEDMMARQPPPTPDDELDDRADADPDAQGMHVMYGFFLFWGLLALSCVVIASGMGRTGIDAILEACVPAAGIALLGSLLIGGLCIPWLKSTRVLRGVGFAILSVIGLIILLVGGCFALFFFVSF